ncbi:histidine kinase dimerization/phosphoacceptor domain -containing protein [Thermodesulfobacteriota bacterium]
MEVGHSKPEVPEAVSRQWQAIVDMLAKLCQVSTALIMKVHASEIEVFVSAATNGNPYVPGERAALNTGLYCEDVMRRSDRLLVPNALQDPKWDHNPDIELGMISYLGYPLSWPDGDLFGTICILDEKDNPYSEDIMELMVTFQETVETSLTLLCEAQQRSLAEDQIQASLKEKEILLKEIHHRVKNNLTLVCGLLSLQAARADETHRGLFADLEARVMSMALAHEKLYKSESLAHFNLDEYIGGLIDHLVGSTSMGTSIKLRKRINNVSFGLDTAIPVGFIVTELVSNCLKHAFPGGREGEIIISLRSIGEKKFELVVSDNGVGIPSDIDLSKPASLGTDLVKAFATKLKGRIEILRDNGTEVRVRFEEI